MARDFHVYSFSAALFRSHLGSRCAATSASLSEQIASQFPDDAGHRATHLQVAAAVIDGTIDPSTEETWPHTWVARRLACIGQRPELAPGVDSFTLQLGRTCLHGGVIHGEHGDRSIADDAAGRRIVRLFREGRPAFGDRFGPGFAGGDPLSDIYGWIDAEEVGGLVALLASESWSAFPVQKRLHRRWETQLTSARAWVQRVASSGSDVFFTSELLPGD